MRSLTATAVSTVLTGGLGCAIAARQAERNRDTPASSWHYQIVLEPSLTRLDARVCFDGAVPAELRAGKDEAAGRMIYARWLGPGAVRRLPVERGRIQLPTGERDGCVGYGVSLAESGSLEAAVRRVGPDLLASPNVWLWRPERRTRASQATLALVLPSGTSALLPWPERAGQRLIDADAFRFDSYAAFGRFRRSATTAHGVDIEAARLHGALAIDDEALLRWLAQGVRMVTESDGQFPAQRLAAVIVPMGGGSDPVSFGMVARGGGASVLLLVNSEADETALRRDWVLAHELSHLLLPFVEREAAWLSEGFATYYQELLRARAGVLSEREALSNIAESLRDAAREGGPNLIEESARMHLTQRYRKVYWGGAAFWLNADVALRRRTDNQVTLDRVLSRLRAEGATEQAWRATELVARLDALAGVPVFSDELKALTARPFPAFEATLDALGAFGSGPEFAVDESAPRAVLRRALFAPR